MKAMPGYARGHAEVHYKAVNNKAAKDWHRGYELVVSFTYGLDEEIIAKIAGLRNFDTGISMSGPDRAIRDLMFPCGTNLKLAQIAGKRLRGADHFGALRLRISYPVETQGQDRYTPWYDIEGKLIERAKHRKLRPVLVDLPKHRARTGATRNGRDRRGERPKQKAT